MIWLLLLGVVFGAGLAAFDSYLVPGENVTIYNYSFDFIYHNQTYSCVLHYFNETPTFLVCNGKILTNSTQIYNTLLYYGYQKLREIYNKTYSNITSLIETFNQSRFDGDTGFPGKEEQYCRLVLGELVNDAYNTPINRKNYPNIYEFYQYYLCSTEVIECSYNMTLVPMLQEFFENSYAIDKNLSRLLFLINNLNIKKYPSQYNELINIVKDINRSINIVENNKFRFDRNCDDCFAVCPIVSTNKTTLSQLYKILKSQYGDQFLLTLLNVSKEIANQTKYRFTVKATNELLSALTPKYHTVLNTYNSLYRNYTNLTQHIYNRTLELRMDALSELITTIKNQVKNRNTTNLAYNLNNALARMENLSHTIENHYKLYKNLSDLRLNLMVKHLLYVNAIPEGKIPKEIKLLYNETINMLKEPINTLNITRIYNNSEALLSNFTKPYQLHKSNSVQRYFLQLDSVSTLLEKYTPDPNVIKVVLSLLMGAIFMSFTYVIGYILKRALVGRGLLIIVLPISLAMGLIISYYTYTTILPTEPQQVITVLNYLRENGSLIYDDLDLKQCAESFNFTHTYYLNGSICVDNEGREIGCNLHSRVLYITRGEGLDTYLVYGDPIYKITYYVGDDGCLLANVK